MTKKAIPSRPGPWKFAGSAGDFHVWHAGKNDYRVTDGAQGEVVRGHRQFGEAHSTARSLDKVRKSSHITSYYSDRAHSGLAALAQ